jgi:hypothetical protein
MISELFSSDENWGAKVEIKYLKTNRQLRSTKWEVGL